MSKTQRINVIWATRHTYTEAQTDDLIQTLREKGIMQNGDYLFTVKKRIWWSATTDKKHDDIENSKKWEELIEEFDVIVGVFPIVARASKPKNLKVFSSVVGGKKGEEVHLRWEEE